MLFTALHRLLGRQPGPLTDDMLDEAVSQGTAETDDLDWKKQLPPQKGLNQTDFPKDIAAMANTGGGVIVYGMAEQQKAASERHDVGDLTEAHERALRSAAITAISPPIFGLGVHRVGKLDCRAVAVVVPASVDVPHLVYINEYFGAPIRNDADTVWMKERQVEAMYRARFDERRNAHEALDQLYHEISHGRRTSRRAWMFGVARPRVPIVARGRLHRDDARRIYKASEMIAPGYASGQFTHPLENVDRLNPRPGLRRWVATPTAPDSQHEWCHAWASVHDDGSTTLASAIGGRTVEDDLGWEIDSTRAEAFVADFMALVRASAEHSGASEYEVRIGIEWSGAERLKFVTVDGMGFPLRDASVPLAQYSPVEAAVQTDIDEARYIEQLRALATDVVNQGGIQYLHAICSPKQTPGHA